MQDLRFSIAGHNGSRLDVSIERIAQYETETDCTVDVAVVASGMQGLLRTYLEERQLQSFLKELQQRQEALSGTVRLENPMERDFSLEITFEQSGKVKVAVAIDRNDYSGIHLTNVLHAEFESDQTFLKHTINQLQLMLKTISSSPAT